MNNSFREIDLVTLGEMCFMSDRCDNCPVRDGASSVLIRHTFMSSRESWVAGEGLRNSDGSIDDSQEAAHHASNVITDRTLRDETPRACSKTTKSTFK